MFVNIDTQSGDSDTGCSYLYPRMTEYLTHYDGRLESGTHAGFWLDIRDPSNTKAIALMSR